ncbi:hypothetical protein LR48_Vigan03g121600 [Vigna angularis]|uniref:Transposase (putative) gypsy type domain-containing protein n=1 Tax=Phaseolus angularis TaxID=3914 RepID=A0A0L9U5Y4_PHAAN|nr:hypothetical protein LR48_Vigan03g121600 [Vigna angularis]
MSSSTWSDDEPAGEGRGLYSPFYITSSSLEYPVSRVSILASTRDADNVTLVICRINEQAWHIQEGYDMDFFYVYITLFRDLCVRIPFSKYQMGVLCALNVAPRQIHPNGWAYMQAFVVVCTTLALTPTPATFLYFFCALPHRKKSWVSIAPVKGKQLFTKASKEKFVSSNKRSKRKIPEGPLLTGPLDLNVCVVERLQYHLELEEKKPFKRIIFEKLQAENKFLGEEISTEQLNGFEQGIAQCNYFLQVSFDHPEFDVMKPVIDVQLVALSLPEDAKAPTPIHTTTIEVPQVTEIIGASDEEVVEVDS